MNIVDSCRFIGRDRQMKGGREGWTRYSRSASLGWSIVPMIKNVLALFISTKKDKPTNTYPYHSWSKTSK